MQDAAIRFGDGKTLPFTPCKKGYRPFAGSNVIMYACPLHDKERRRRVKKEGGKFRKGEFDLNHFWSLVETEKAAPDSLQEEDDQVSITKKEEVGAGNNQPTDSESKRKAKVQKKRPKNS